MTRIPEHGEARRFLLYSHDTYGLGHLRRNLAIAARLLGDRPSRSVVLVSGSPVSDHFAMPNGLSLVKLPSVVKVGPERYEPLAPRASLSLVRRARSAIIADVVRRFRPDVLLVDHAPAGMSGELRPVFDEIAGDPVLRARTRVSLGLRDIIDEPEAVLRNWSQQGIADLLESVYDELYVYGCKEVFDFGAAYGLSGTLASRLKYCGYLDKPPAPASAGFDSPVHPGRYVLATAGGGGDGAEVLASAIEAGRAIGIPVVAVAGPLMGERDLTGLTSAAERAPGTSVVRFHPSLRPAMARAAAVVTMGGYNSLCEAVAVGTATVVVPRVEPRREQAMRAELFARRGLVQVVLPGPSLPDRIADSLQRALSRQWSRGGSLDLGGLDRLSEHLTGSGTSERARACPSVSARARASSRALRGLG